jgi:hypothetical protein
VCNKLLRHNINLLLTIIFFSTLQNNLRIQDNKRKTNEKYV